MNGCALFYLSTRAMSLSVLSRLMWLPRQEKLLLLLFKNLKINM